MDAETHTPTVLIAGASSAAGTATAAALLEAGARVAAVGSDAGRLAEAMTGLDEAHRFVADLADPDAVTDLRDRIHADLGPIDALIHLVGGWRGGGGLAGQTDEDWDFLHRGIVTTLRNTSRVFYQDLLDSPAGRLAIVSSTATAGPTASGANYAAAKSAAESWIRSVADGFARAQSRQKDCPTPQRAAAVTLVVKALVTDAMRQATPERAFAGFTDVTELARAITGLLSADAAELNATTLHLND